MDEQHVLATGRMGNAAFFGTLAALAAAEGFSPGALLSGTAMEDVLFLVSEPACSGGQAPMRYVWAPGMEHALYFGYADLVWSFFSRFSRDPA